MLRQPIQTATNLNEPFILGSGLVAYTRRVAGAQGAGQVRRARHTLRLFDIVDNSSMGPLMSHHSGCMIPLVLIPL